MYNKARAVIEPFAFDRYRKDKIRQQIDAARPARLKIKSNLPKVNQELALKFMEEKETAPAKNKKAKTMGNLLDDNRFKAMFENPEFEVDKNAMEYKMLTPVLSRLDKSKVKELKRRAMKEQFAELNADEERAKHSSDDEDFFGERSEEEQDDDDEPSSDDDHDDRELARDMKKQYKQMKKDNRRAAAAAAEQADDNDDDEDDNGGEPKMVEMATNEFRVKSVRQRVDK